MPTLPALPDWEQTSHSLHQAAQLLGAIRQLVREPVPNYLELALHVERNGLSTDVLPSGGEILLNMEQAALVYTPKDDQPVIPVRYRDRALMASII